MRTSRIEFDPAPSAGSRKILDYVERRIVLIIAPPAVGRVTLSNDPVTADGAGYVLAAGETALHLTVDLHGDIVRRAWYALYSAGATGVGWIQVLS